MALHYPARDGHPSMFEPDDPSGATEVTKLHRSVDRLFADPSPMQRGSTRGRLRGSSRRSSDVQRVLVGPRPTSSQGERSRTLRRGCDVPCRSIRAVLPRSSRGAGTRRGT